MPTPAPIEMHGLCPLFSVFDMPAALHFYCDILGFEVFSSSTPESDGHFDWCWLKLNETELMLNTAYERRVPDYEAYRRQRLAGDPKAAARGTKAKA